MRVVVVNRDQQGFVRPMRDALTVEPVFVFDRCAPVAGCTYITNSEGEGFLAGRMRDIGANGYDGDILFLDGDKVPQGDIMEDINSLSGLYDCICYGVTNETAENREFMHEEGRHGVVPFQATGYPYAYGCYSCGMWLSSKAVKAVRKLNGSRIFHPSFDGAWGDEDNFLADELDSLGFRIGYSTRVRLAGTFSDWRRRAEELTRNFMLRIKLRKDLLGRQI